MLSDSTIEHSRRRRRNDGPSSESEISSSVLLQLSKQRRKAPRRAAAGASSSEEADTRPGARARGACRFEPAQHAHTDKHLRSTLTRTKTCCTFAKMRANTVCGKVRRDKCY
eukprot:12441328-Alexandrium_andersonii.AAC.1